MFHWHKIFCSSLKMAQKLISWIDLERVIPLRFLYTEDGFHFLPFSFASCLFVLLCSCLLCQAALCQAFVFSAAAASVHCCSYAPLSLLLICTHFISMHFPCRQNRNRKHKTQLQQRVATLRDVFRIRSINKLGAGNVNSIDSMLENVRTPANQRPGIAFALTFAGNHY